MKSITVHGLDHRVAGMVQAEARRRGISQNQAIKRLLEKALGVSSGRKPDHRADFTAFLGRRTEADAAEFEDAVSGFGAIDAEDCK